MPYRRNNYDFVIDSSFTPFTMQEMLVPFMAYKDAFEKSEEAYTDLTTKADKFKYLAKNLDPNSEAAKIYNGYANDLKAQAEDLANNGLSMGNRSALTNLKRRYQGEIGRLVDADTELRKEKELRRQMSAKDPSMLWAADNLTIDNYLDGNTPNLYGISGTELYTKAAAASQAASKRQFSVNGESKTLGGYYYDYVQKMGYNPSTIAKFRSDMSAIPELQQAAEDILKANGVTDNLTGRALEQAKQQVINGMIDGAVYSEQHSPQRNLGVMTAAERDNSARGWASFNESKRQHDLQMKIAGYDNNGVYHPELDQTVAKAKAIADAKNSGKGGGGKGSSTEKQTIADDRIVFEWSGNPKSEGFDASNPSVSTVEKDSEDHPGTLYKYEDLPDYAKRMAMKKVGRGNAKYYDYYFEDYSDVWGPWNTQAKLEMVPRRIVTDNKQETSIGYGSIENDPSLE